MSYKILATKQFSIDFKKIKDKRIEEAIKDKIEEVSQDPTRYKRLHYDLQEWARAFQNHLFPG